MKLVSTSMLLLSAILLSADAEMHFHPAGGGEDAVGERRLGRCGWGQFSEDTLGEFCMAADSRGKVFLERCINDNPPDRQLWRFEEKLEYNYENLPYDCGGLLKNKAGDKDKQCLAPVRSGIKRGRRLALGRCNKGDEKQQWLGDGDILSPESKTRLCVWFRGELLEGAAMVLKKCENLDSLNFGRK